MKRKAELGQMKPPNTNTNKDNRLVSVHSCSNGVTRKLKLKRKRPTENADMDSSDFDDMSRSRSRSRSDDGKIENTNQESNLDKSGCAYYLRSKTPRLSTSSDIDDDVDDEDDDEEDDNDGHTNNKSNRLQQPPVYINSNLMKVKMECDYNPIVLLKREPAEKLNHKMGNSNNDDDDEQDQVVSSSASPSVQCPHEPENECLTNRTTFCTPTSPVTSQASETEIEIEQNQNQQEKDNVEADDSLTLSEPVVTENETEEEKEESIAKLADKIKNHADRISSFVREQTEIKMSLESKITQLNLVIGQLKTEIQDLNSTATEQRDENNRLKAQLDQQQEEIEELHNKLKLQDQNQNQNQQTAENSNASSNIEPNSVPVKIGFRDFPLEEAKLPIGIIVSVCPWTILVRFALAQ